MDQEPSVHTAANIFREMCYNYRDQLTAGIIVAGWDKEKGGQVTHIQLLHSLPDRAATLDDLLGEKSSMVTGKSDRRVVFSSLEMTETNTNWGSGLE